MNENAFVRAVRTLEFDKIREMLIHSARTEGAKEKLSAIVPSADEVVVKRLQSETSKAKELIVLKGSAPFGGARDISEALDRAQRGASLSPKQLLSVASTLRIVSSLNKYAGGRESLGCLAEYFGMLQENPFLEKKISAAVVSEDIIADDASDNLYKIRREMRKTENGIKDTLAKYTNGSQSKYLQENIVTIRSGRYVVPVKAEYKNEVKGLLHDTSASGATFFIEPLAVLEANNKLRELKSAEEDEIEKILVLLTEEVVRFALQLTMDCRVITDLDCIFARAELSFKLDASEPILGGMKRRIKLLRARHPLLPKESAVPISLEFGDAQSTMIITGPNTGGKTVTLKTIGLFAMMAQCGLHIPCDYGSCLPIFSNILADIGDEQSIEQSLSTFSAHMVNVVEILKSVDEDSLVLFDELGAGTDPVEGAALAIAILERIKALGAISAATTHYSELKLYAIEHDDVLNASCEFDVETLKPTYRLITGLPGKSNAFAISSRLGISDEIISRATELLKDENVKFETVLSRLEEQENSLEKEREAVKKAKAEAEKMLAEATEKARGIEERTEKEIARAREQANAILASARASSDFIFDTVNQLQKDKDKADAKQRLEQSRAAVRSELRRADGLIYDASVEKEKEDEDYVLPRALQKGDPVLIYDIKKKGTVISVEGKNAVVQAGIIKTKVKIKNLRLLDEPVVVEESVSKNAHVGDLRAGVKNEIDLRGETGDDAWFMVDRYLDSAITAGYQSVRLIHGKGTGALRAALWRYLRSDKRISSFRSGRYGEGDTGVTVVELTGKHK